jgi:hypothetical protein
MTDRRATASWMCCATFGVIALAICSSFSWGADGGDWRIREEKTLIVDGVKEVWQLRWLSKPENSCGADDAEISLTCPCSGFAYGQKGRLALIRIRRGQKEERLELGPLFPNDYPNEPPSITVQEWAPAEVGDDSDWKHFNDDNFEEQVRSRKPVDLMHFADYDHDGKATEFLIQVATLPCGKHQMALVGISRSNPHLHAFSTTEKPMLPLILSDWEWDALLKSSGGVSVIDWYCGDHGSNVQWKMQLERTDGVLHAKGLGYSCPVSDSAKPIETQIR